MRCLNLCTLVCTIVTYNALPAGRESIAQTQADNLQWEFSRHADSSSYSQIHAASVSKILLDSESIKQYGADGLQYVDSGASPTLEIPDDSTYLDQYLTTADTGNTHLFPMLKTHKLINRFIRTKQTTKHNSSWMAS
jgi:hypothetical protein